MAVVRTVDASTAGVEQPVDAVLPRRLEHAERADQVDLRAAHRIGLAIGRQDTSKMDDRIVALARDHHGRAIDDIAENPRHFRGLGTGLYDSGAPYNVT